MADMLRINARVSPVMMAWLDKKSEETGIPKSTLVMLALEDYRKQQESIDMVGVLSELVKRLERIENQVATE